MDEFLKMSGLVQYIDFKEWCDSTERHKYTFKGKEAKVYGFPSDKYVVVEEKTTTLGIPYCTCICPETCQILKVPASEVTYLK